MKDTFMNYNIKYQHQIQPHIRSGLSARPAVTVSNPSQPFATQSLRPSIIASPAASAISSVATHNQSAIPSVVTPTSAIAPSAASAISPVSAHNQPPAHSVIRSASLISSSNVTAIQTVSSNNQPSIPSLNNQPPVHPVVRPASFIAPSNVVVIPAVANNNQPPPIIQTTALPLIQWPNSPLNKPLPSFNGRTFDKSASSDRQVMADCMKLLECMIIGNQSIDKASRDIAFTNFFVSTLQRRENKQVKSQIDKQSSDTKNLDAVISNIAIKYNLSNDQMKPQVASLLSPMPLNNIRRHGFLISSSSYKHSQSHAIKHGAGEPAAVIQPAAKKPATEHELTALHAFLTDNSQAAANRTVADGKPAMIMNHHVNQMHSLWCNFVADRPSTGRKFHVTHFRKLVKRMKVFKRPQGKASDMCPTCNRGKKTVSEVRSMMNRHSDQQCIVRNHISSLLDLGTESASSITDAQERVRVRTKNILDSCEQANLSEAEFTAKFGLTNPSSIIPCNCIESTSVSRLHEMTDSLCYYYHHYHLKDQRRHEHEQEIKALQPGKLLIIFDFKANLIINRGPVEVGLRYFNRKQQSLMGFAVYERLKDNYKTLRMYYIDVISNCLSHDSHAAWEQTKIAVDKALTGAKTLVTEISFWCDNGGHFLSHDFTTHITADVPEIIEKYLIAQKVSDRSIMIPAIIPVTMNLFVESHGKSTVDSHFSVTGSYLDDIVAVRDVNTTSQLITCLQQRFDEGEKLAIKEKRKDYHPVLIYEWKPNCVDSAAHDHFADPNIVMSDELDLDVETEEASHAAVASIDSAGSGQLIDPLPVRRHVQRPDGKFEPEGKAECKTAQAHHCRMEMPSHELDLSYVWSCPSWRLYQSIKSELLERARTLPESRKTTSKTDPSLNVVVKLTATVGECRELHPKVKVQLNHTHSLSFGARLSFNESTRFSSNLVANMKDRASHVKSQSKNVVFVAALRKRGQSSTVPAVTPVTGQSVISAHESLAQSSDSIVTHTHESLSQSSTSTVTVARSRKRPAGTSDLNKNAKRQVVQSVSTQHLASPVAFSSLPPMAQINLQHPAQLSSNMSTVMSQPTVIPATVPEHMSGSQRSRAGKRRAIDPLPHQPDVKRQGTSSVISQPRQISNQIRKPTLTHVAGHFHRNISTSNMSYPSLSLVRPNAAFNLAALIGPQPSNSVTNPPINQSANHSTNPNQPVHSEAQAVPSRLSPSYDPSSSHLSAITRRNHMHDPIAHPYLAHSMSQSATSNVSDRQRGNNQ